MCNLYAQTRSVSDVARIFGSLDMPLQFPEGIPNLPQRDVAITDMAPIVRTGHGLELVVRRWSWPGPSGKPVYNFRSEGRLFDSGRCLIIADGFYEFSEAADRKQKRKDRWLFTDPKNRLLGIAGLLRDTPGIGQAFTMLTTEPGPDVAPYHKRQIAVLKREQWRDWLNPETSTKCAIEPLPAGSLPVQPVAL